MSGSSTYDLIVVGGGHAGCEAAGAGARLGLHTLLISQDLAQLARMSCNPAIGGLAKGHLVREIDALGGIMGVMTDKAAIQSRMLNRSKGAAVWSPRAQCDRYLYTDYMIEVLRSIPGLNLEAGEVIDLLISESTVTGVKLRSGEKIGAKCVILCGGTFWNGVIHIGEWSTAAGRISEPPALGLSDRLSELGLRRLRFKTGTPPRLDGKTIDFSRMDRQDGDADPVYFSGSPPAQRLPQQPCFLTYSNSQTHDILRSALDRSPLYTGRIKGTGPRYCPSIEDKIVRFAQRDRHQLFLEPEGLTTDEYYPNGFSTSLPEDVQIKALRTVTGLEDVVMNRPGYAVEYDVFATDQIYLSLECRLIKNLYLAGQINGTSGYEEAASQGLMAGINAARSIQGKEPIVLGRDQAYIGVLIDDLITKVPEEPYRMFTSRSEFRLLLRQDNAGERLLNVSKEIGLASPEAIRRVEASIAIKLGLLARLQKTKVRLEDESVPASIFLRRPEVTLNGMIGDGILPEDLVALLAVNRETSFQVEIEVKYDGYLSRERLQAESFRRLEDTRIPDWINYGAIKALSAEAKLVLTRTRPATLGQAKRLSGVRSSDLALILVMLKRGK
ncbi:MAG: tRNA uridine-5-carboxymethylaminomethyl(34) synthesis enzyme MnmG [bacterium]|nr:tRNA uridine-5-carboxymethylaminomethyl(34) synthesis enzyme MnmG [bacterium]